MDDQHNTNSYFFIDFFHYREIPERFGISIRFIGNRDLIPEDIMVLIERLEEATKKNTR